MLNMWDLAINRPCSLCMWQYHQQSFRAGLVCLKLLTAYCGNWLGVAMEPARTTFYRIDLARATCFICFVCPFVMFFVCVSTVSDTRCVHGCLLRVRTPCGLKYPLQWRDNGRDSVSNHQPHDCLHFGWCWLTNSCWYHRLIIPVLSTIFSGRKCLSLC